jgi:hypothetical protein
LKGDAFVFGATFCFVLPILSDAFSVGQMMGLAAWAQSENPDQIETPLETEEGSIDRAYEKMTDTVLGTADWIDSFFYDERIEAEEKKTHLRLTASSFTEEGEGTDFDTNTRLRVVLPALKKRLRLVVSGDPDDDIDIDNTAEDDARERLEATDEENGTLAFWYFFKDSARRHVSLQGGVRFPGGSPVVFVGPRFRRTKPLAAWTLRGTQAFRWFSDEGWESKTRFDLERPLYERFFLRTTARGSWFEGENGFFYRFGISLFQPFSPRRILKYEGVSHFQTRPNNRLELATLALRYRQRIWRDWLFVEVAPQGSFPRDRDFEFTPGILFRLEVISGLKGHLLKEGLRR